MIGERRNELRLKDGFVMIGVLQQTQPPTVLPEAFFVLREIRGKMFQKSVPGLCAETDRQKG